MTDSMNFGPEWLRNLSSEGSTGSVNTRYQLADYRYGREEMLALYEKGLRAPNSLSSFAPLYSEQVLPPLALIPQADDERGWTGRPAPPGNSVRGRGTTSLDRGGRGGRGRGPYQTYSRGGYDSSGAWTGNEPTNEWSPRKDFARANSVDNWRRHRTGDDDEGWRMNNHTRVPPEKWSRSTSWRDGGDGSEERGPPQEKSNRTSWQEGMRGNPQRRPWENEDHLPEWAMENSMESGGSFDSSGAFHGCSDDEQREHKSNKRDLPLQKSVSQQNITVRNQPTKLPSSQSTTSLCKPADDNALSEVKQESIKKEIELVEVKHVDLPKIEHISKPPEYEPNPPKINNISHKEHEHKQHFHNNRTYPKGDNIDINGIHSPDSNNRVDEEFERSQEDFVKKLVIDEDMPKKVIENFMMSAVVPPPNLAPPNQDNWYYQDPQGDLQGPFLSSEMAEWFRAGYFTSALLVKRLCDEAFYRLGDLVTNCGGNPFQSSIRIATLKQDPPRTDELLKYQILQQQLALRQAETMMALSQNEGGWVLPQQMDLISQQVLNHPQMASEMQFFQQPQSQPQQHQHQPVTNPLMNMINQMQQANKLPSQILGKKPSQLDPIQALVQQMGGLQTLPNTGPNSSGLPANIPTSLQNNVLLNNFSNLQTSLNSGAVPIGFAGSSNSGLHNSGSILSNNDTLNRNGLNVGMPSGLPDNNLLPPRPTPLGAVDSLSSAPETDPLKNLLQQLQNNHQTQQLDSLWKQNQFNTTQSKPQWQSNDVPISMWDLQHPPVTTSVSNTIPLEKQAPTPLPQTNQMKLQEKERQRQLKENLEKEQRRQKELDEKLAKKEAEERRKEEQRKQEAEKKAAEEKRKKEEEHIKKELEKAKREAEEKRLRELEEKRRLKELRKAEEEARRKMEDQKKSDEVDRVKREIKEKEEQVRVRQMEVVAQQQQERESVKPLPRVVPWSQPSSTPELSLADIQRAEREKRAEQVALLQQQKAQQALQQEQIAIEKQSVQLNWSKKPVDHKSIKSFAEIQQEEHDRFTKQTAGIRAALKEKEASIPASVVSQVTPWSGQGLSWASTNQWNNNIGGFWDEGTIHTQPNKPSALSKSNSASVVKQVIKQSKSKLKKEEQQVMKLFSNGPMTDEFTEWCTTTLKRLNSTVDIPTFINFLRDIESALEVKDYCKEYFGDVPATQQFVTQFLEKRRMFRPKVLTQTDDMSSPAPALTPSMQHSTEFQEVKGKIKKSKKSKMIKVDARNLGFSVTAAPDRINVGDRDYVEN